MADGAPGAPQALSGGVEDARKRVVVGRRLDLRGFSQRGLRGGQQLGDGGSDVLRADGCEIRQRGGGQQGLLMHFFPADSRVLTSSMAMVIGPTPPGTG